MVITRQDCLEILTTTDGTSEQVAKVYSNLSDVIKTLKAEGKLDIWRFYEKLRKQYNGKQNKTYINIMKEIEEPQKVLTTLSSLVTQILLFLPEVSNKQLFLKHVRFSEILDALNLYSQEMNIAYCIILVQGIKKDVKYLESI